MDSSERKFNTINCSIQEILGCSTPYLNVALLYLIRKTDVLDLTVDRAANDPRCWALVQHSSPPLCFSLSFMSSFSSPQVPTPQFTSSFAPPLAARVIEKLLRLFLWTKLAKMKKQSAVFHLRHYCGRWKWQRHSWARHSLFGAFSVRLRLVFFLIHLLPTVLLAATEAF